MSNKTSAAKKRKNRDDARDRVAKPMHDAFESQEAYSSRFLWKRGGSVFSEHIHTSDYVDASVQKEWEMWQRAWNAALAHNIFLQSAGAEENCNALNY
jgi:hypothetical protein